jgi:hypothetical protein
MWNLKLLHPLTLEELGEFNHLWDFKAVFGTINDTLTKNGIEKKVSESTLKKLTSNCSRNQACAEALGKWVILTKEYGRKVKNDDGTVLVKALSELTVTRKKKVLTSIDEEKDVSCAEEPESSASSSSSSRESS